MMVFWSKALSWMVTTGPVLGRATGDVRVSDCPTPVELEESVIGTYEKEDDWTASLNVRTSWPRFLSKMYGDRVGGIRSAEMAVAGIGELVATDSREAMSRIAPSCSVMLVVATV